MFIGDLASLTLQEEYDGAVRLFEQMHRLHRVWSLMHPPPPLRRSELAVLGVVDSMAQKNDEPVTVGHLARAMHQSPPAISKKVSALERAGFLAREADKEDRRVAALRLTKKGRDVANCSLRVFLGSMEEALASMGSEKTGQLLALMAQLTDALEKAGDPPSESKEDTQTC